MMSEHIQRTRGRPKQDQGDARIKLIDAARSCFSIHPYAQVTTRMLAKEAGVNAALIRYYFLNKEGLYQQMLVSVADLFQQKVIESFDASPDNPFEAILRAHRAIANTSPDIPKLIFKELAFNQGKGRQMVMESVAKPNRKFMLSLFERMPIRKDFDPSIFMFSILSMSLMPLILQDAMELIEGVKMDAQQIEKVIWQNAQMIQFGCLERQSESGESK